MGFSVRGPGSEVPENIEAMFGHGHGIASVATGCYAKPCRIMNKLRP